jgi:pimeloyl-ACP methyl ester carboxylesterase
MPQATNNGIRIHYEVEGQGPPLLLHTGFMGSIQRWYYTGYAEALRDDYRLIILDPRGQGESDKPHDVDAYALETVVADIVAVLDAEGVDRAHFMGFSMGGVIGFGAGVFAPERFLSLIISGASPYFREPGALVFLMPTVREDVELLRQGMPAVVERAEQLFGPLPPESRATWFKNDNQALAAIMLASERYPDISADLPALSLPALIFCGTEDPIHDLAQRASEAMPNARFVPLDGLDHFQTYFRSDLVLPHVRAFLEEVTD